MRKLRYTLLGVFCAGLLLIGIGVGVSVTEFTELTYVGEKVPVQAQRREETFHIKLAEPDQPIRVMENGYSFMNMRETTTLTTSEAVTPGQVEVKVVYDTVGPTVDIWSISDEQEKKNLIGLECQHWNEFGIFMACKDEVLRDLRAGTVGSYLPLLFESVTITVHPSDAAQVYLFGSAAATQAEA